MQAEGHGQLVCSPWVSYRSWGIAEVLPRYPELCRRRLREATQAWL